MIAIIRSTSARSSGPNSLTGEALLFRTGSPNLTTCASAASRRSSSSASSSLALAPRRRPTRLLVAHRILDASLTSRVYRSPSSVYCGSTSTADRDVAQRRGRPRSRSTASRTAATVASRSLGLDQEPAAVAAADAEHRRRAEQVRSRRAALGAAPSASRAAAASSRGSDSAREHDPDQVRERRVAQRRAAARARRRGSRRRRGAAAWAMLGAPRGQGLDDHPPAGRAAAAAPGELGDHREGPLLGAEVGEAQGRVGVDDRAQGHLGEVVALGDHLGADEDARSRPRRSRRGSRAWAPRPAAVSESSRKTGIGPRRSRQQLLDPLGAGAGPRERGRAALGAGARQRLGVGAVVADEAPAAAVDDQRDVAVGAAPVAAAGAAVEPGGEAAAVDHHDRLGARRADRLERLPGGRRGAGPERGSASRMSSTSTGGIGRPSTRRGSSSRGSSSQLSGRGVAVPATSTAPRSAARRRATARAS